MPHSRLAIPPPSTTDPLLGSVILVVDDTDAQRYATTRRLTLAGFQVVESATGTEGLARAQEGVELVVLDINLPDLSGFEVARALKAHPATAHLPILHTSSERVGTQDRVAGLDAGADGYLTHPVESIELVATVRSLLRLTKAERALHERTTVAERALAALADSEALFRTVQDASTSGFGLHRPVRAPGDADGAVIDFELMYVNPAGAGLLGRAPESLRGARMMDVFPGLAENGMFADYVAVLDTGIPWTRDIVYQRDGFDLSIAVSVVRVGRGADAQLAVNFTDMRERALVLVEHSRLHAEARLARTDAEAARAAAEQANVDKSTFLVHMSHELRTPLHAILGYAQLLEMGVHGPVSDAQLTTLARIVGVQRHMLGLVNDVLHFATLSAGHVQFDLCEANVHAILHDVLAMVEPQRAAKRLTIEVERAHDGMSAGDPGADPAAGGNPWADPDKLSQVLLNLVANAVKFTAAGGRVHIEHAVQPTEASPHGVVCIRVVDTGIGIADGQLETIFEPFVQVHPRVAGAPAGAGLGLAISRGLVRGMGGDLRVESVIGEGSTFTVTLPCAGPPGDDRRDGLERRGELDRRASLEDAGDTHTSAAELPDALPAEQPH
ncbi:MAG: ATP-binding protein [Gemmatimonadota bacterium]